VNSNNVEIRYSLRPMCPMSQLGIFVWLKSE